MYRILALRNGEGKLRRLTVSFHSHKAKRSSKSVLSHPARTPPVDLFPAPTPTPCPAEVQGDGLQRLAEAHVVGQDAPEAVPRVVHQPMIPRQLVGPQPSLKPHGRSQSSGGGQRAGACPSVVLLRI